jgi:hypothetical protein
MTYQTKELSIELREDQWQKLDALAIRVAHSSVALLLQLIAEKYLEESARNPVMTTGEMAQAVIALIGSAIPNAVPDPAQPPSELLDKFLASAAPFPPGLKLDIALLLLSQIRETTQLREVAADV